MVWARRDENTPEAEELVDTLGEAATFRIAPADALVGLLFSIEVKPGHTELTPAQDHLRHRVFDRLHEAAARSASVRALLRTRGIDKDAYPEPTEEAPGPLDEPSAEATAPV